jgi:hypothetical protein
MPPVPNPTGTFEEVIEITPEVIEPESSTSATEQTTSQQTETTITRSTGHDALDEATCRLLRQRAEFSPAKDSSGRIVPGSYSSSVNWRIP